MVCPQSYKSGSKRVETIDLFEVERKYTPGPPSRELSVKTADGWWYRFKELVKGDGFELKRKRHADMSVCDDDTVPQSIIDEFKNRDDVTFTNVKTLSDGPTA